MTTEEDQEARRREELEYARKQREKEMRAARKREQAARDPHRKIQLKLENKRRFEIDTLDQAGIPMKKLDFMTSRGRQKVPLVDVRGLVCQCQGLAEGIHNVRELVEKQSRSEKFAKYVAMSQPASTIDTPQISKDSASSRLSIAWDEREFQARKSRAFLHSTELLKRYKNMRDPPERLPHSFDIFTDTGEPESSIAALMQRQQRRKNSLSEEPEVTPVLAKQRERRKSIEDIKRLSVIEASPVSDAVRQRARQAMVLFRGVVRTMCVWMAHRRIIVSGHLIRQFLRQLGEWSRIRSSCQRLIWSVRHLQRTCRSFLALRNKRCEFMHKEWQRVEDSLLTGFFKLYGAKAFEDKAKEIEGEIDHMSQEAKTKIPESNPHASKKQQKEYLKFVQDQGAELLKNVNWRAHRIPIMYRRAIISRFYMIHLRKHIRSRENMLKTVQLQVKYQREVMHFLKSLGVEETSQKQQLDRPHLGSQELNLPEFWHIGEDVITELIAIAAKFLGTVQPPFNEHPINKSEALTEDIYDKFCRPPRKLPEDLRLLIQAEVEHRKVRKFEMSRAERASSAGRGKKNTPSKQVPVQVARQVKIDQTPADIEELFCGFTPRLHEISEQNRVSRLLEDKDGLQVMNVTD